VDTGALDVAAGASDVAADPAAVAAGAGAGDGTDVLSGAAAAVSGDAVFGAAVFGAAGAVLLGTERVADGAVLPGTERVASGAVVGIRSAHLRVADGAADDFPVTDENVAADVRPANASDDNGRPSWPITTGDPAPVPGEGAATTGTARTSAVTTVLSTVPSASRPLRCPSARPLTRIDRASAPVMRATSGGPAGRWCTEDLTEFLITIRYRRETNRARRITVSRRDEGHTTRRTTLRRGSRSTRAAPPGSPTRHHVSARPPRPPQPSTRGARRR
jgi:hypothetical protein